MTKILFVCLGNICRSPMAEFLMRDLVEKRVFSDSFEIGSAATSTEEIGNSVYPPVRSLLTSLGIDCSRKRARQITKADYQHYDLIIGMESSNVQRMKSFFGGDPDGKLHRLMDYTDTPGDVADPWYTRDFDTAYHEILKGCQALLDFLRC